MAEILTAPSIMSLNQPSSDIQTASGSTSNMVATTDGRLLINIEPGTEFPPFGGQMEITVPFWYSGGSTPVFNIREP